MRLHANIIGFDWDKGNKDKNLTLHKVGWWECEEVFFNYPLYLFPDIKHCENEERFFAFGFCNSNRLLIIVFTVRQKKIRVISARDMNKKERNMYHEKNTKI
ncbi:MAG: BrnT family toxin [Bacteroidota bacterium]